MPERTITLLTAQDPLSPVQGLTGALVEAAPDAPWMPEGCVPCGELVGSWYVAKQNAATLVGELLKGEPEIEGVRHLYALKEILIRAAYQHQLTLHLDDWLRSAQVQRCVFRSPSSFAGALRTAQQLTGNSRYEVEAPIEPKRSRIHAAKEYIRFGGTSGLRELPWLAVQRLFPIRARMMQRRSAGPLREGDWWFYSTFFTFTNIGLAYELALGRPFRYMIELRGSAEKPLQQRGRDWDELYKFARPDDRPLRDEIETAQRRLRTHLEEAAVTDATAKTLLLYSGDVEDFFARMLPIAMLQVRVLRRWLEQAKPGLIVVGNEAWEGHLLQLANTAGIPTIVLQHGIFGDFYQLTEHSGDVLVARGEFWKEFLSKASQKKSVVLNCDAPRQSGANPKGKDLLFVTTDYRAMPYWHKAELDDVMLAAAGAAAEVGRKLVVRIHPRDAVEPYKDSFRRISQKYGTTPEVEFSTGAGLEEKIRDSAVALLYFSTVFLDCLKLGVPIVSPGWHDFAFKESAQRHRVFNFAQNMKHLRELLVAGLRHELRASDSYEQFLANTPAEDLRSFFESRAAKRNARA